MTIRFRKSTFILFLLIIACQAAPERKAPAARELPTVKIDVRTFECDNEWAYQLEGRRIEIVGYLHPDAYVSCRSAEPGGCSMNLKSFPTANLHKEVPHMQVYIPRGSGPNQVTIPSSKFTAAQVTFFDNNGMPFKYTNRVLFRGIYRHNPYSRGYNACELEEPFIERI